MIMTQDKALKSAIRARMAQAGEPYNVARRAVLADGDAAGAADRIADGRVTEDRPADAAAQAANAPDAGEDFYDRYLREAAEAGVPAVEAHGRIAAERASEAAEQAQVAADLAQERADEAEEAAGLAEERAELAEESASMAEDWADPAEQQSARRRADEMRERADRAREEADRAQQAAEHAQERADMTAEAAETAAEDWSEPEDWAEHVGPHVRHHGGGPRPPRAPRPPAGPGWHSRGWDGPERITERVEDLIGRLNEFRQRTEEAVERITRDLGRHEHD
jgi:hypothetical protein